MSIGKRKIVKNEPRLPALKTLIGGELTEDDLTSLAHLAHFNNTILHFVDRYSKVLKGQPFQVRDRRSPGGLEFKTIQAAKDLTPEEYEKLTEAINPEYKNQPIEEILVNEGLRSLLQIRYADVRRYVGGIKLGKPLQTVKLIFKRIGASIKSSINQQRLHNLRKSMDKTRKLLERAETENTNKKKANLQAKALTGFQNALTSNLPHISYKGPVLREWQSPRRTLHRLDAVCMQKTVFAHAILNDVKPRESKLKPYPVNVLADQGGVGITHECLLCPLADGSYFLFDANLPEASGRVPNEALDGDPLKKLETQKIIEVNINQETIKEEGYPTKPHKKLQLLKPTDTITSIQYYHLGIVYSEQAKQEKDSEKKNKLWGKEIKAYKKTIEANPRYAEAHNSLGIVYYKQDKLEEAISEYKTAIKINPRYAEAHTGLGDAYRYQGKTEEAIKEYKEAIKINSQYSEAHNNLGVAYHEQGKLEEAIKHYREAIKINPRLPEAHNSLGVAYYEQGKLEEAISEYKTAIKINPRYAEAHTGLGIVYYKQDKLEEAISEYKTAIKINPRLPQAHNNLGGAYYKQDKVEKAIKAYKSFLQHCPKQEHPELQKYVRDFIRSHK